MDEAATIRNRLLAVVVVLLLVEALRVSYAVTMPVAVAFATIATIWPVKAWLGRKLPYWLSLVGAILVLCLVALAFCLAVYFAAAQAVEAFIRNEGRFVAVYGRLTSTLNDWGLPDPGGREGYARLIGFGRTILANVYSVGVYVGFIAVLVILGMVEVPAMRRKLRAVLDRENTRELGGTVEEIADKIRAYLWISTVTSLVTGFASAAWAYAIGLELALVWGVLNFLLNYIPVIGNLVGIVPPVLYALVQFDGWAMPLVVLAGFAALQLAISNVVYPLLQGRSLALSPFAILVALSFWSWIWGIAGALIAIPVTAALVIVGRHFPSTAWLADLVAAPGEGAARPQVGTAADDRPNV